MMICVKVKMLKWSVISRRSQDTTNAGRPQSSGIPTISNCLTPRSRTKRPHSETVRRRISLPNTKSMGCQQDKENQFTSTPIKSLEDLNLFDPFRDVSNLTPKDRIERGFVGTKINHRASLGNVQTVKNVKKDSVRKKSKKRKSFLTPFRDNVASQSPQFFKHFDRVDSHIGALPDLPNCDCDKNMNMNNLKNTRRKFPDIYAPTLPTFTIDYSPSSLKTTHCLLTLNKGERATPLTGFLETKNEIPLSKKPKIDHVNDFLHQISFLTSPEETGMIYDYNNEKNSVKMSPLVKRFVDLGFSNKRKNEFRKGINDSSFINDLSLNQIVDAILDETNDNYSNIHIENNVSKHENELNETHEENMVNADLEKKAFGPYSFDRYSLDSGFKSSTTTVNSHQLDSNFKCKCSNLNNTTIKVNETFNERCVDRSISRKRPSSEPDDSHMESKRLNVDNEVSGFSLRRQKCIRRRKSTITQASKEKIICSPIKTITQNVIKESEDHALNDVSFESSIVSESDVGKLTDVIFSNSSVVKENSSGVDTPSSNGKGRIRRCLLFDSPEAKQGRAGHHVGAGLIHLKIQQEDGELNVHVIKALNLTKTSSGPINSYVKVYLSNQSGELSGNSRSSQRTAVQADSNKPFFNHVFKLGDCNNLDRLHVDVWHRNRSTRTSEFLGCTSFSIQDECQTELSGAYLLLPQSRGRHKNIPITPCNLLATITEDPLQVRKHQPTMCDSRSNSMDEMMSLDEFENVVGCANKTILSEQQKSADENLFLRYLELDPVEGPEAIPAATQRRATGIKNGRTPFTHTKRLMKAPKSGFGFSVVWTHPPRIERVEKGLPADRAGILPGDYLIFVDKHNVVMMPEIDILNLIRSYGNQLTLEIFRRNSSRNGSVPSVKRMNSVGTVCSAVLPTPTSFVPRRPSTVCSTNTASVDCSRKKLHLPQVTFSSEVGNGVVV